MSPTKVCVCGGRGVGGGGEDIISMHIYLFVIFVCFSWETDFKKAFACF
jgi:hypothetical protein